MISALRAQTRYDVFLVGVDMQEDVVGAKLVDEFVGVPRADDTTFVSALLDVCVRFKVDYILPILDPEMKVRS